MSAQHIDSGCPLRQRVIRFKPLYYWLEYWGDWLGPEGDRDLPGIDLSPLAKMIMRGKNYIRGTGDKTLPRDVEAIEKALSPLKLHEKAQRARDPHHVDQYRILYRLHNRKWGLRQIEAEEGLDWYKLDTNLERAYTIVQVNVFARDPTLLHRQPPTWR